ncbi:MAG: 30S ribosomal protein S20 [Bacteroidales bacterium]|jgi:small subunit ribosomal protein S20|nr:30S ribosomal protein S20 [Bacteroidales bacterium]
MANHKSAKKRIRTTARKRTSNRLYAKTMRNSLRDFRALTEKTAMVETMPSVIEKIDKLAKKGVIHKNKASNLKSKLMKKTNVAA